MRAPKLPGRLLLAGRGDAARARRTAALPLQARRWIVSPGYGAHPVYWVTWTGAAAFAACHGARLPFRAEMIAETDQENLTVTNHGYQAGDTIPASEPGREPGDIHHLAGNLQIWCCDASGSNLRRCRERREQMGPEPGRPQPSSPRSGRRAGDRAGTATGR